jgi:hypothetical protein
MGFAMCGGFSGVPEIALILGKVLAAACHKNLPGALFGVPTVIFHAPREFGFGCCGKRIAQAIATEVHGNHGTGGGDEGDVEDGGKRGGP